MSENNFDDDIKRKLESIRPAYSEAAWQKLKRSLPIPWYMSFLRNYGTWMFGGLATVAFLGSQYNNQIIRKENKLLHDKISTINSLSEVKTLTDSIYVRQNDTVYATKYVTRYVKVGNNFEEELAVSTDRPKNVLNQNNGEIVAKKNVKGATPSSNISVEKDKFSNKSRDKEEIFQSELDEKVEKNNAAAETNLALSAIKNEDRVVADVSEQKMKADKLEDISGKTQEGEIKKENIVTELIIPENKALLPVDQAKNKKIDFSRINARFGVSGDYMGHYFISLGPTIEVFLGKRFSLNTGLLITGKHAYKYKLVRDFNLNTGKKFEDKYRPFIGEKPMKIENIEIETSSIKLPIYLSYYVPFKSNFAFMFSTGTKLDLSVVETIKFNEQGFDGSNYFNKFENQYNPKVFNNFYYGMGVEYKYKRLVGQMTPFFEFPFRQPSYLVSPKKFGVNASLKFSLKK